MAFLLEHHGVNAIMDNKKRKTGRPPKVAGKLRNLVQVALDDSQLTALREFQQSSGITSESAAVRSALVQLLRDRGLLADGPPGMKPRPRKE